MADRLKTRVTVFVLVTNDKGEILLQQRANTSYLNGYWDFPSGHLERGETLPGAAVRELYEEVRLTVRPEQLRLTHVEHYFMKEDYLCFTFTASEWEGEPVVGEPEKCSAIGWFAPDALPEKCVNAVRSNEQTGFSDDLTYSITDFKTYEAMMGEPLEPGTD